MKKFSLILLTAVLATSCLTYQGIYQVGLTSVEKPENAEERFGKSKIVTFEEEGKTKYSYEDDIISIIWVPGIKSLHFSLQNKTDHSIKIIWDEAVFVDFDGSSQRIMHAGVKYVDRNNSQPPTTVVRNAKIDDLILPTENVRYISGQYGGWHEDPIFPNKALSQEDLDKMVKENIGKTVQVLLPLKIEETVNEYLFSFKVEDFIQSK